MITHLNILSVFASCAVRKHLFFKIISLRRLSESARLSFIEEQLINVQNPCDHLSKESDKKKILVKSHPPAEDADVEASEPRAIFTPIGSGY